MEFQITEAVELIKTLAETENLTQREAFQVFVTEAGLDVDAASQLKAALFETYTLQEMASDSLTKALVNVFINHEGVAGEDIHEVDTKETQEGTKYKVRVKDRASGSSYIRYATREKVAELRANPNISSVEMTDYGTTGEDDRGDRTAAAKRGDRDGDGKVESGSKEHAGVVHNAIQRKMGGKPDGQDTRKEEYYSEGTAQGYVSKGGSAQHMGRDLPAKGSAASAVSKGGSPQHMGRDLPAGGGTPATSKGQVQHSGRDTPGGSRSAAKAKAGLKRYAEEFELEEGKKEANLDKMERQENKHRKASTSQKGGGRGDSKNKSNKMSSIRGAIERGEDARRDTYGGKRTGKDGTHPPEDHRKSFTKTPLTDRPAKEPGVKKESAWEQYQEIRENRRAARAAGGYKDDSKKQTDPSKDGFTGISGSIKDIMKQSAAMDAEKKKSKKKVDEGYEVTDADERGNTEAYKRYKAGNKAYTRKKAEKKVEAKEEWKPDPTEKRKAKGAKLGREEEIERGKSKKYGRDEDKIKDLYKRRMAVDFKKKKSSIGEDFIGEGDLTNAGNENKGERERKKLTGKGVDNSTSVKLMPRINETVLTGSPLSISEKKLSGKLPSPGIVADLAERMGIVAEECCPKCGTPECTCEGKKEEKPKKKREPKAKLDEAGMPITEYVASGPTKEMIAPPRDAEGAQGVMNPKGVAKRYKRRGEAPGDRRPNDITGPDLPNERGTVPNGSGV